MIAINIVFFILQQATSTFTVDYALIPRAFSPTGQVVGVSTGEYYRLITSAFLHNGILHIFFNMYALLIVGPTLEAALGRIRFVALYFIAAFGGSTLAYLLTPAVSETLGASGAIFGLFGALFVVARRLGRETGGILGLIGINLVITFAVPHISWQGHLGGLVTGVVVAAAYAYAPRKQQAATQLAASAVVLLILVALVGMRTHALRHQPMPLRIPSNAAATAAGSDPSRYAGITTSPSVRSISSVATDTSRLVVRVRTEVTSRHG
jgi:membrane associated rhomboid family serine protease